jgi:hypothetical protein
VRIVTVARATGILMVQNHLTYKFFWIMLNFLLISGCPLKFIDACYILVVPTAL